MTGFVSRFVSRSGDQGEPDMRFKDDKDFLDREFFHPPPLRGGVSPRGGPPPRAGSGAEPRLSLPATRSQKVTPSTNKALALAVADLHSYLNRGVSDIRAKGRKTSGPKALDEQRRSSQAISEAAAKRSAKAAASAPGAPAKAIAADRRLFNPTPGPKTVFGTQAHVVPNAAARFRFAFPAVSGPCVARKTRKEVLFAFGRAGGRSSRKRKVFGPYSKIGC